jgi:predicted GNAT family N-acyltransferase
MVSMVTVDLATGDDLAAAFAVRHEVFVVGQGVPPGLERDDLDETADHLVGRLAGRVMGTGRLVAGDDGVGVLGRLAVLEEARGAGLGVALVRGIEERARERGLHVVELHAQTYVREFYERLGYKAYGEEYLEAGIPHISMSKAIG